MNIPDHIFESLETIFWVQTFQFFYADADPGSENLYDQSTNFKCDTQRLRDPGSGMNVPDHISESLETIF
jgi:hypothetical protein